MNKLLVLASLISACAYAQVSMDSLRVDTKNVDFTESKVQRDLKENIDKKITFSTSCTTSSGTKISSKDAEYESCLRNSLKTGAKNTNKNNSEVNFKF